VGFVLPYGYSLFMTTIAAIEGDGWAVIGADSQSSDESGFAIDIPAGKIFKNGEVIVAGAGAVRGINLLEHNWVSPAVKIDNIDKYVTSILIPSIRKCFDAADYEYKKEEGSVIQDNIFIICIRGAIYRIDEDYGWERTTNNLYVAGSGERFALGALEALKANQSETITRAKNYIRVALKVASKYDAFTGGDIKFMVSNG
jgi:ATP-dependent protease HslVU (ClpYQ) peptidase subunit